MTDLIALRAHVEQAVREADPRAVPLLQRLFRCEPSSSTASFVVRAYDALWERTSPRLALTSLRLFFLSTYTLDPILPLLKASAYTRGIRLVIGQGGFNNAAQLALDPHSALYTFEPQLVVLAHQTRDLAPRLYGDFASLSEADIQQLTDETVAHVSNIMRAVRTHSRSQLVVHTLDTPVERAWGVQDLMREHSQVRTVQTINTRLVSVARELGSSYLLDSDSVLLRRGAEQVLDERRFASVRLPFASSELLPWAEEWLRFIHPVSGRVAKVAVCDLDNTLWGGVIGEDGIDGIQLGNDHKGAPFAAMQRALLDLKERGILLALCSKNNEADALEVFARHPAMQIRMTDVAAYRINWQDKAQNMRELASTLNLGLDSFVFLDDNPVERAWVREQLPEVTVLELPSSPYGYARAVRSCPLFERLAVTSEDRERTRMMAAERERKASQSSAGSVDDFLRSLEQEAIISVDDRSQVARIAQLTQKTNQFNLTTRRYSEPQILEMMEDVEQRVLGIQVRDRFGDHGLTGVAILRKQAEQALLDTFLLSCRVLSRSVETALLAAVCEEAKALGTKGITAELIVTKKNAPAADFLPAHAFQALESGPEVTRYQRPLEAPLPWPPFIARKS